MLIKVQTTKIFSGYSVKTTPDIKYELACTPPKPLVYYTLYNVHCT